MDLALFSHDILYQVKFTDGDAARGDDQVRAGERSLDRLLTASQVVAHGRHVQTVDPQIREAAGQVLGIGVEDLAQQQLGPDGKDFRSQSRSSGMRLALYRNDNLRIPTLPFLTTKPRP